MMRRRKQEEFKLLRGDYFRLRDSAWHGDGWTLPLAIAFRGSFWSYLGWYLLTIISVITIIGWAWVTAAWIRWICRHIDGTRREVVFNGSGWEILWRTVVFSLLAGLIIPIPWVLAWYTRWFVSQFALLERVA